MPRQHYCPNGRPIHPACELIHARPCGCDELWDYWDGTQESLDQHIAAATRLENRRQVRVISEGIDITDLSMADAVNDDDLRGFFKESERLKDARI